jgi:hypothetical protein
MKVNNIQTYNNSNNSFKALRFKQGYVHKLATMSDKVLSKMDTVRDKLADTVYYHLDIGYNDFYICHENGERLYLPLLINKAGKVLLIKAKQGLTQISKKLKYDSTQEVNNIYNKISKTSTQFERAAEIVKVLDDYEKKIKP